MPLAGFCQTPAISVMELASVKSGVGVLVGGTEVGVVFGDTAVGEALGVIKVGVLTGGTDVCVPIVGTGVGAAAGATHPIKVNVTNISPIHW